MHPRLGVVAPDAAARDAALSALRPLGASPLYPSTLARITALDPHRIGGRECARAESFSARLYTLPTHARIRAKIGAIVRALR